MMSVRQYWAKSSMLVCCFVLQWFTLLREHMDDVSASVLGEVDYAGMLQCDAVCIYMDDVSASVLGEVEYAGMSFTVVLCRSM